MQPECISQRASSGRLNCSCSRSRDLTAINPVVPEMMKIAALAVSTAPGGNMSFAFSKSVPIAPAKGRGKRTPAWTNRRAKALAIYAEDSRETTLENILAAMPYMDEDMRQLAAAAVNKLQAMTDSEFSEREFILTDEE